LEYLKQAGKGVDKSLPPYRFELSKPKLEMCPQKKSTPIYI